MNLIRLLCGSLVGLPFSVVAATAAQTAQGPGVGQLIQVILALVLVLACIVGGAWLMRRYALVPGAGNTHLRVVSGVMVGTKERVVVVEVDGTWLVLGVTHQQVNLLHTLDKPADVATTPATPAFAQWLQAAMAKRNTSS
ncbi:flagellar biosynthetic protein FliO [uncultured Deefgea sp.]|uniref:flagellar biosynthetic protein FliO n=1 Tax=uncultured Deefgea sp. TaxID=1304914 RepID=UPI0025937ADC|nr:flagellar biosynthetic protein FliO [uncultured Deefgea sp.]